MLKTQIKSQTHYRTVPPWSGSLLNINLKTKQNIQVTLVVKIKTSYQKLGTIL